MGTRVGITLGVVLVVAVAFGAGWLARGQAVSAMSEGLYSLGAGLAAKEDEFEYWRYPGATGKGGIQVGSNHMETSTTSDPLEKVASWYSERLGVSIVPDKDSGPGGRGGDGVYSVTCNDSFQAKIGPRGVYLPRAVKIGVRCRRSLGSSVTVVVNQLDGEDRTHIILNFHNR